MTKNDPHDNSEPEQDEIRRQLSAQPAPEIPASVSERITAALAEEQQRRTVEEPRRNRWWIPLGAAAAIALLVGIVVIPGGTDPEPQPIAAGCQTPVVEGGDLGPVTQQSGRDYTQAELADQAKDLVAGSSPCPAPTGNAIPSDRTTAPAPSPVAADISNCLLEVIPDQTVVAIDIADFEGEELLVAVVATETSEALVVDCAPSPTVVHRTELE
ncbi:MAG: hypothetical protein K0U60_01385 [Actinomycetia bacterium]|nr:hypothetical protein [Actinomycetes bacterium]MCH9800520.1 hypothetical protein [Actinomycetes bacterium]